MMQSWPILPAIAALSLAAISCSSSDTGANVDTGHSGASTAGATSPAAPAGASGAKASAGTTGGLAAAGTRGGMTSGAAGTRAGAPGMVATAGAPGAEPVAGAPGVAGSGAAGTAAAGGGGPTAAAGAAAPPPMCMSKAPAEFMLNTSIGNGGSNHKDSAHFALYNSNDSDTILNFMESAHQCFIMDWCFRTPGLSVKSDDSGPYYKTNIFSDAASNAGGLTYWDMNAELSYIHVLAAQASDPRTTVHEYGHAITMSEYNWIDQKRTGYWWETIANWVAYTYLSSPYCDDARTKFNVKPITTINDQMHTLQTIYGQSYSVICNDQNYYQAWPFFTFLTNNPDNYPGLGKNAVQDLMRKYMKGSNETPLHTLDRIAAPVKAQTIIGRYWARMAYFDIGMPVGQKDFLAMRGSLNFAGNLDGSGDTYTVKSARKPQYFGANITPLAVSGGDVSVMVKNLGNGQMDSNFTATLSIHAADGSTRYVDLPGGTGSATIGAGEEASLVVVNTPDTLIQFDPQYIGSPENIGLNYSVQITGATPM
jgi:hypothetical protein